MFWSGADLKRKQNEAGGGVANLTWVERGEIAERPNVIMDGDRDRGGGRKLKEGQRLKINKRKEFQNKEKCKRA